MEKDATKYSPIWIGNESGHAYFTGSYIWNKQDEVFEIEGLETTGISLPTDRDNTAYLMKKIEGTWQIALKPDLGGSFVPLKTQLTDKIVDFISNKHEWNNQIVYPHHSHPYK